MKRRVISRVIVGILFFAAAAALVYYRSHRAAQANVEAATGSRARASERDVLSSSTQTELDTGARVWPIYAEVLSNIRSQLRAHFAESGDSRITIDLPDLPENLYEDRYSGTVFFGDAIVWTLEVFAPRPARLQSPPTLTIRFDDPRDLQEGPRLIFSLDTVQGEVAIIATNGVVPSVGPIPTSVSEEDPDATIARLTRSIVEAQLLRLGATGG